MKKNKITILFSLCFLLLAVSLSACSSANRGETAPVTHITASTVSADKPDLSKEETAAETESIPKETSTASDSIPKETAVNWEQAYAPILDRYHEFTLRYAQLINDTDRDFYDWEEPWATMGAIYPMEKPLENFGYAFRDIDNNGTPELVLLGKSDLSISAIYTVSEGKPLLLGTYWERNACTMDESANIYISWSDGASDNGKSTYHIASDGKSLVLLETVGIESYSDTSTVQLDEPEYYRTKGTDKVIISEEQAHKAWLNYPSNNDKSGLEFLPIIKD